jgi:uncharacterized membrane protein SpoIIM required for sporulation
MKEISFIKTNKKRWNELEAQINVREDMNPDNLADSFIQLTDDLSYARTFYPESNLISYLNGLSAKTHALIYRNKKEKTSRLRTFWVTELPLALYQARKEFFWSLVIFLAAVLIGAVSAWQDDGFLRIILGDQYVNKTLDNIEKGDPMAVYKSMEPIPMFLIITANNIYVSFVVFIFGLFTSLGTTFFLFKNGLMLGAFQMFFMKKSLMTVSSLAIMIHGTIELSAIVLAGGAGILLGNSIFFPGTYPRATSFKQGVLKGTKIMLGLVPFFIIAGFLEGFITRYYGTMSLALNLFIIVASLSLIVGYFTIYPRMVFVKETLVHRCSVNSQ